MTMVMVWAMVSSASCTERSDSLSSALVASSSNSNSGLPTSARAKATPKITLPSPTLFINFWSPENSRDAYPTLDAYLADVVALLREEVAELSRLGATYVQLDAPHYTSLLNATNREFYEGQGWTIEGWLDRGIELENAVMEGHPELTFGFHL